MTSNYCVKYLIIREPQVPNSNRMIILIDEPNIPVQNEKMKYSVATTNTCHVPDKINW